MNKLFKLDPNGKEREALSQVYYLRKIQNGRTAEDDGSTEYALWRKKFDNALPGILGKIFTDFNKAADIDAFVAAKTKECLQQLGHEFPVIKVREYADDCCDPRAYEAFPEIRIESAQYGIEADEREDGVEYELKDGKYWYKKTDYYMSCPVGYDGGHFTPEDATIVDAEQQKAFEKYWHGGWTGGPPTLHRYGQGVALPEGYISTGKAIWLGQSFNSGVCFRAEGKALEIINGFSTKDASGKLSITYDDLKKTTLNIEAATAMRHDQYGDRHYLLYQFENDQVPDNLSVPAGLQRVPLQERNWLAESKNDLMTCALPPAPDHLAHLAPVQQQMQQEALRTKDERYNYIDPDGLVFIV